MILKIGNYLKSYLLKVATSSIVERLLKNFRIQKYLKYDLKRYLKLSSMVIFNKKKFYYKEMELFFIF